MKSLLMLDYVHVRELVREISALWVGQWIRKVSQPHASELVLYFSSSRGLVISLLSTWGGFRLQHGSAPSLSTPFLLLCRKHLEGKKLLSCREIHGQKIVVFSVREAQLVVEIPGIRNRALLLGGKQEILATLPRGEGGQEYAAPVPPRPHLFLTPLEELRKRWPQLYSGEDRSYWGLSPFHWKVLRAHDQETALRLFLEARAGKPEKGAFAFEEGVSLFPVPDSKPAWFPSVLEAVTRVYGGQLRAQLLEKGKKEILRAVRQGIEKRKKTLGLQEAVLEDAARAEMLKHAGDLLLAFAREIKPGQERFADPESGENVLLDPRLDGIRNAQAYYKKYKKAKQARVALAGQMERLKKEIAELETLETWATLAEDEGHLNWLFGEVDRLGLLPQKKSLRKKKVAFSRFLTLGPLDGFVILVGRNESENAEVLRQARKEDLWFHAKEIPGGHVVVRADRREVPEEVMVRAAQVAAYYSQGRDWDKVPVDFTRRKELRPIPGGKARVTYRKEKTLLVQPRPF